MMYYTYPCSYCGKVFYTFNDNRETASGTLYSGVLQHLKEYGEEEKEHQLDDGASIDTNQIYSEMNGLNEAPSGGYEL